MDNQLFWGFIGLGFGLFIGMLVGSGRMGRFRGKVSGLGLTGELNADEPVGPVGVHIVEGIYSITGDFMFTARTGGVALIVGAAVMASGCSSDLTRGRAASILGPLVAQGSPMPVTLFVGDIQPAAEPLYRELEKTGIVRVAQTNAGGLQVTMTDRGLALTTSNGQTTLPTGGVIDFRQMPFAVPTLVEVTGVRHDAGGKTASVDYTWRYAPSDITRGIFSPTFVSDPSGQVYSLHSGQAKCELYDDGWRCRLE